MIKAIKNRIFIKKDELPEKIGSIYIPKTEGQHDLAGSEFKYNDETILSIRENDVTAIIL